MSKTGIKKIESEDVKELSDEALDRTADAQAREICLGSSCDRLCAPSD